MVRKILKRDNLAKNILDKQLARLIERNTRAGMIEYRESCIQRESAELGRADWKVSLFMQQRVNSFHNRSHIRFRASSANSGTPRLFRELFG